MVELVFTHFTWLEIIDFILTSNDLTFNQRALPLLNKYLYGILYKYGILFRKYWGVTTGFFFTRHQNQAYLVMMHLKPLQNKKGQKNLGYPKKKQSFSKSVKISSIFVAFSESMNFTKT